MTSTGPSLIDPSWIDRAGDLAERFRSASPFPHVVLDDFLRPDVAQSLLAEFPEPEAMPRSRDYVFGAKRELSSIEASGPAGAAFHAFVTGDDFATFLSEVCGHEVFVDPAFHGGGFHQGGDGSFLDLHVDFNVHPLHDDWLRTLNVLVYLSEDWDPAWGGHLVLKSHPDDEARLVEPVFNRAVIMATDERTYHGYRRMALPEGVTRRSIATYAYRHIEPASVRARTTGWAPEDASIVKRSLARVYGRAVKLKNRVAGSGTARNR